MVVRQSRLPGKCKIYKNVKIGRNAQIGDYVIIGLPPRGLLDGETKTRVGKNAIIRSHTVIYAGNVIGDNFQTGHGILIRENNIIGSNVRVGTGSDIEYEVKIGDNVLIHSRAFIPEFSIIEDDCYVGPNVVFTNTKYPLSPGAKRSFKGSILKKKAKIGANSTILPGVIIGENSLVGAGSVVTKDVPPNKVVIGSPAKIIKDISALPY